MESATFTNPNHPIPEEVAKGFELSHREELERMRQNSEVASLMRPDGEAQSIRTNMLRSAARTVGIDLDEYSETSSKHRQRQVERLSALARTSTDQHRNLSTLDWEAPAPRDSDPSFWYANAQATWTEPFSGRFLADGLHFTGWLNYDGSSLSFRNFGVKTWYELQADRIPPSASNRWRSDPHMEIFGNLSGDCGGPDLFSGDRWSKCWMIRRQTLYQNVFGPPGGDNRRILGERIESPNLFFLETSGLGGAKSARFPLPGFQWMPSVTVSSPFPGLSIWAEIELRFDIQLEGKSDFIVGPFADCLVRGFQWPLVAV
ncbi:hypothetical protein ACFRCG_39275 [Embleya sp. NPDC056575]|uniref:hypothetical protein n=1 Tax=unclassified Embleya TaxID=2699296 RepID=UPI0036CACFA9